MKDDLFDHLKHKLAETSVPDPDRGWQHMNALLDAQVTQRPAIVRHAPWYVAAASVLLITGGVLAFYHELPIFSHKDSATIARKGVTLSHTGTADLTDKSSPSGTASASAGASISAGANASVSANISAGASISGSGATPAGSGSFASVNSSAGNGARAVGGSPNVASSTGKQTPPAIASTPQETGNSTDLVRANEITSSSNNGDGYATSHDELASLNPGQLLRQDQALNAGQDLKSYPSASATVHQRILQAKPASIAPHKAPVSHWGLEVGVGMNVPGSMRNVTVNGRKEFEPGLYPALQADYRFNAKWSLSTGVAIPSPVSYAHSPTNEDLLINSTNVSTNNTTTSQSTTKTSKIGRLLYADIPLVVKWALLKHVSIEGGGQLSYLVHQQMETNTQSSASGYSSSNPSAYYYVANSLTPSTANVTYYFSHVPQGNVKKVDPRYVLGASYQLHRFSADVQYQGSLRQSATQYDDSGNQINDRTSIVQLKVMYSFH